MFGVDKYIAFGVGDSNFGSIVIVLDVGLRWRESYDKGDGFEIDDSFEILPVLGGLFAEHLHGGLRRVKDGGKKALDIKKCLRLIEKLYNLQQTHVKHLNWCFDGWMNGKILIFNW